MNTDRQVVAEDRLADTPHSLDTLLVETGADVTSCINACSSGANNQDIISCEEFCCYPTRRDTCNFLSG